MTAPPTKRVLVLGGTTDALKLVDALCESSRFTPVYSLAGRLKISNTPKCETRVGGFGGIDGLCDYITKERIDAVIDATHPFAARISYNAEQASQRLGLPLLALVRPPWSAVPGDIWHAASDMNAAAEIIHSLGRRIFLTIGRQEASAFAECTEEYFLIRAIEEPDEPLPPNRHVLLARGPFQLADELQLLSSSAIDVLVTKNSGGDAAYPKIQAARDLKIPVVMVQRPRASQAASVANLSAVVQWLEDLR
jgi:precorrin-6A/cobalt-precorrin-6A reductase